jgi:ABC-type antimicrobial peptide transport system permease subunit
MALAVGIFENVLSLVESLRSSVVEMGEPDHVVVLREGATTVETSALPRDRVAKVESRPEVRRDPRGEPVSTAVFVASVLMPLREPRPGDDDMAGAGITAVRGLEPGFPRVLVRFRLLEGRLPGPAGEVIVGRSLATQIENYSMGRKLRFGRGSWTVVGTFEAAGAGYESEVWTDLETLLADQARNEPSAVLVAVDDPEGPAAVAKRWSEDPDLDLKAVAETDYYSQQTAQLGGILTAGLVAAALMAIGSVFAGMTTLYTAVARRVREIGTLRALGFRRRAILVSFLSEGLLLGALAAVLGSILAAFSSFLSFQMIGGGMRFVVVTLRPTLEIVGKGALFALAIGLVGGSFPAIRAARIPIVRALRQG